MKIGIICNRTDTAPKYQALAITSIFIKKSKKEAFPIKEKPLCYQGGTDYGSFNYLLSFGEFFYVLLGTVAKADNVHTIG